MNKFIGLIDNEKELKKDKSKVFPNLALMKISSYYKSKGYIVEWFEPMHASEYEMVFLSKVFTFTDMCDLYYYADKSKLIMGGTGINVELKLDEEIEGCKPDYSLYNIDYSIGFLTRGCNNRCPWCVVPKKEGSVHRYQSRIIKGSKELHKWRICDWMNTTEKANLDKPEFKLLDNNFLQYDFHIELLKEMIEYSIKYNVRFDFNQGLDIRMLNDENISYLTKIKNMEYLRFSCDSMSQVPYFEKNLGKLIEGGLAESRIFIYLLVTDDISDAEKRVDFFRKYRNKVTIYAQAYRDINNNSEPTVIQKEYCQRFIYPGIWRKETWEEYLERKPYLKQFKV